MKKSISHCQGKGSLSHNNRQFYTKNIDRNRTCENITFVKQPISDAYDICFNEAVERYNAKQKRNDRKIKTSYFENVFKHKPCNNIITASDNRKSFYEDLVQIGTKDDTGVGTPDRVIAARCLTEYMEGFQKRNPNFYVFNAVLHMDEATPHLHIDYIPIGHYKRGVDTQNGLAQALKEMGYGTGADTINRWRIAERKVLEEICNRHGIEISEPHKSRGYSYTVDEYKELQETKKQLNEDIHNLEEKRDNIMHYKPNYEKTDRLQYEYEDMCKELIELMKNPVSMVKNSGRIKEIAKTMVKSLKRAYNSQRKSEQAQAEITVYNNEIVYRIEELEQSLNNAKAAITELSKENRELSESAELLKYIDKDILKQAAKLIQIEKQQKTDSRRSDKKHNRNDVEI